MSDNPCERFLVFCPHDGPGPEVDGPGIALECRNCGYLGDFVLYEGDEALIEIGKAHRCPGWNN